MEKKEVVTAKAPAAIGPYSQAIVVGDFVFTSGVIPADANTGIIPSSVDEQFMRALHNLREVLVAAGSDQDHVIRTTVYMKDQDVPQQAPACPLLRSGGRPAQRRGVRD